MSNGFDIKVTESNFKAKEVPEQLWILFQGIEATAKGMDAIDKEGCEYARKKQKYGKLNTITAISAGMTAAIGFIYIIYQMTCR